MKYHAKRIKPGLYQYRGYTIKCLGYFSPDKRTVWEAFDERGYGYAQSYTFRSTKMFVDYIEEHKEK